MSFPCTLSNSYPLHTEFIIKQRLRLQIDELVRFAGKMRDADSSLPFDVLCNCLHFLWGDVYVFTTIIHDTRQSPCISKHQDLMQRQQIRAGRLNLEIRISVLKFLKMIIKNLSLHCLYTFPLFTWAYILLIYCSIEPLFFMDPYTLYMDRKWFFIVIAVVLFIRINWNILQLPLVKQDDSRKYGATQSQPAGGAWQHKQHILI